jgi:signal peptidase I
MSSNAKKKLTDFGREWLDTLVVAFSVAFAFRAYFYQPFNIPTASMQPTLWGHHTRVNEEKTKWDVFPASVLKWAATGEKHVELTAPVSGVIRAYPRNDGYADLRIGMIPVGKLPSDACAALVNRHVTAGEVFWKGTVALGDFIFVNRWLWNFRKPRVNDVMIFSTTGIPHLMQGTHYIKRMKATPGQTYSLEHPVQDRPDLPTTVTMGKGEYFACGDNYNNSFDSRYWGVVPAEKLRGIASVVFWPFSKWRIIR